jgi:hypothetical protein
MEFDEDSKGIRRSLPSEEAVHGFYDLNLIKQLGLEVSMVIKPDPRLLLTRNEDLQRIPVPDAQVRIWNGNSYG